MIVRIYGSENTAAYGAAKALIGRLGHTVTDVTCMADLAIAPLLTEILPAEVLGVPVYGTLIFHPSPLPYGRGASAIKYAYKRQEAITAATWFWADSGIDTGDICEQEIVKIDYSLRPREFYEQDILPAMLRTLERALKDIAEGHVRKVPQVEKYSTYDRKL